jgi:MFS family permease
MSILLFCFGLSLAIAQPKLARLEGAIISTRGLAVAGLLACAGSTLLIAIAPNFLALLSLRILQGLSLAAFVPSSMSLLLQESPIESNGATLGLLETAKSVGFGVGPLVGGGLASFFPLFATYVLSALLMIAASFILGRTGERSEGMCRGGSKKEVFKESTQSHSRLHFALACGGFIASSSAVSFIVLQSELAEHLNQSHLEFSLAFSAMILARLVFSPIFGRVSDTYGAFQILLAGMSLLAFGTLGLAFCTSGTSAIIWRALSGLGMAMFYTPCMVFASRNGSSSSGKTERISIVSSGFALGATIGPLMSALLVCLFNLQSVFLFWGVLGVSFVIILRLSSRRNLFNCSIA